MKKVISRIAPTPSGYLHIGNAYNFLLTWKKVKESNGILRLRIDDADATRMRPEFVEDIFENLDWLGIQFDQGPSGPEDFFKNHSQMLRMDHYRKKLKGIRETYACECSRKDIQALSKDGLYPGTCKDKGLKLEKDKTALRISSNTSLGDFVVWRKDDLASYQLSSVIDDIDFKTNLIVRGEDLKDSTEAQLFLAEQLDDLNFAKVNFIHHPLLTDQSGGKLAKSKGSLSLKSLRDQGVTRGELITEIKKTNPF